MLFEFDTEKSASNKDKHGLDFEEAQALWLDDDLVIVPARDESEPRQMAVGKIADSVWIAIFTMRNDKVRIISVRRARKSEVSRYEDDTRE